MKDLEQLAGNLPTVRHGDKGVIELWCWTCKVFKPANNDNFHTCTRNRTGYASSCKPCCNPRDWHNRKARRK